jgi:hypothetical protein
LKMTRNREASGELPLLALTWVMYEYLILQVSCDARKPAPRAPRIDSRWSDCHFQEKIVTLESAVSFLPMEPDFAMIRLNLSQLPIRGTPIWPDAWAKCEGLGDGKAQSCQTPARRQTRVRLEMSGNERVFQPLSCIQQVWHLIFEDKTVQGRLRSCSPLQKIAL